MLLVVDESALMVTGHDDPVSPELVLVDPVLRERLLRESLDELLLARTEALPRAHPGVESLAREPEPDLADLGARPTRRPAGRRRARGSSVAVAMLVALFLALPSLAFLPPRQAPQLGRETVSSGQEPIVAWQADPTADYYVFEMSAGGHLVMVEPVREPSVTLRASLPRGRYAWRVFAGRGPMADHDTRGPIAGGTVTLE